MGKEWFTNNFQGTQIQALLKRNARQVFYMSLAVNILKWIFLFLTNDLQDQFGDYDENEIKKIDENINISTEKLKRLQETLKTQETGVIVVAVFFSKYIIVKQL